MPETIESIPKYQLSTFSKLTLKFIDLDTYPYPDFKKDISKFTKFTEKEVNKIYSVGNINSVDLSSSTIFKALIDFTNDDPNAENLNLNKNIDLTSLIKNHIKSNFVKYFKKKKFILTVDIRYLGNILFEMRLKFYIIKKNTLFKQTFVANIETDKKSIDEECEKIYSRLKKQMGELA